MKLQFCGLRMVAVCFALIAILATTAFVATPASAHSLQPAQTCSGDGCNGLYPDWNGCTALAYPIKTTTLYSSTLGTYAAIKIMRSPNCNAAYTQVESYRVARWILAKIQRVGTSAYNSGFQNAYTVKSAMVGFNGSHLYALGCVNTSTSCYSVTY